MKCTERNHDYIPPKARFTLYDLVLIAALSAIGLAIKPLINPMIHIISSSLRVPGGSLSGGFLMMWMVLARVIINKPGTAIIFGFSQGLSVMLLGFFGSHGVFSIVSYTLPGVVVEVFALFFKGHSLFVLSLFCIVANMTGTLVVAFVVMQLPLISMILSVLCSFLSGMLGGYFSDLVLGKMKKYNIVR